MKDIQVKLLVESSFAIIPGIANAGFTNKNNGAQQNF